MVGHTTFDKRFQGDLEGTDSGTGAHAGLTVDVVDGKLFYAFDYAFTDR